MKIRYLKSCIGKAKKFTIIFIFLFFIKLLLILNVEAATYTVTTANPTGAGSLPLALINANATMADDTILFNISGCPNNICTIDVGPSLTVNSAATSGKLTITASADSIIITSSGNAITRVFTVNTDADLVFDGIIVQGNQNLPKDCIYNTGGKISILNSKIRNSGNNKSGIESLGGIITITNSEITGNGIGTRGTANLTVRNTKFADNGLAISNSSSQGTIITDSTIINRSHLKNRMINFTDGTT